MEYETVYNVFYQCPCKQTTDKESNDAYDGKLFINDAIIQKEKNSRNIHTVDHNGMCFGHHFQIFTLENLALSFVFYLFNMHDYEPCR
jgi:hypothetical protein